MRNSLIYTFATFLLSFTCNFFDIQKASEAYAQEFRGVPDTASGVIRGDFNLDYKIDYFSRNKRTNQTDIDAFILALTDPVKYSATYRAPVEFKGDINDDGKFDYLDIEPFIRLMFAEPPKQYKEFKALTRQDELYGWWNHQTSNSGRYLAIVEQNGNFIEVFDTFSDTSFKVTLPKQRWDFDRMYGFEISANGRYLVIEALKYVDESKSSFYSYLYRYDLHTGAAIQLYGGRSFTSFPAISSDGNLIAYRSAELIDGQARQFVYLQEISTRTIRKINEIQPHLFLGYRVWRNSFSDDGRYILTPSLKSIRGLVITDTLTKNQKVLLSGESNSYSGGHFISNDGSAVVFAERGVPKEGGRTKVLVYLYDTASKKTTLIHEFDSDLIPELSITNDGNYIIMQDVLYNRKTGAKNVLEISHFPRYKITGDGKYVYGLRYEFDHSSREFTDYPYIAPNPYYKN